MLAREEAERQALEAELRAADFSLAEEKEEIEEPDLSPALLALSGALESAHLRRMAQGKCRRALKKAGKKASSIEVTALLHQLFGLDVRVWELSSSRIARAIRGDITLESLVNLISRRNC